MPAQVKDVMTGDPTTVSREASLTKAAALMRDGHMGDVLVAESGRLTGVLTDRDIVIRAVAEGRDPASVTVGEVCSTDVVALSPDDDSDHAVRLMRDRAVRRLPVVDNGRIVGIVSIGDMAVEKDERSALSDISAAPPNT
ncbi:MAG: CBS domain-containing protein [Streptosporangiales bacterium]|nr:CBS domain-containing protein [Streptosporangiales bacterium]